MAQNRAQKSINLDDVSVTETLTEMAQMKREGKTTGPRWNKLTSDLFNNIDLLINSVIMRNFGTYIRTNTKQNGDDITEELKQEAWIWIMTYVDKYDPSKAQASTFLYNLIKKGASEAIYRTSDVSQHYSESQIKIQKARKQLEKQGIPESVLAISLVTKLPTSTIRRTMEIVDHRHGLLSYDTDDYEGKSMEGTGAGGLVTASTPDTADQYLMKCDIEDSINELPAMGSVDAKTVREIARAKFLCDDSMKNISDYVGISQNSVSKILSRAKELLGESLRRRGYGGGARLESADQNLGANDDGIIKVKDDAVMMLFLEEGDLVDEEQLKPKTSQGRPKKIETIDF